MKRTPIYELEPNQRGSLRSTDGACQIGFYTIQPAPTQWVAVGQVISAPETLAKPGQLMVESERDESTAIARLGQRCPLGHPDPTLDGAES